MSEITSSLQQKEKTAQFLWTGFILLFFVIQAILWIVAITLTSADKSHAILPDYDQRALQWDEQRAQQAASRQLGWTNELKVDPTGDLRGFRAISLKLTDREQQPVGAATIQLRAFHRGRAGEPQDIRLQEVEPGVYAGVIQVTRSGRWQFQGQAAADDRVLLIDEQQTLTARR